MLQIISSGCSLLFSTPTPSGDVKILKTSLPPTCPMLLAIEHALLTMISQKYNPEVPSASKPHVNPTSVSRDQLRAVNLAHQFMVRNGTHGTPLSLPSEAHFAHITRRAALIGFYLSAITLWTSWSFDYVDSQSSCPNLHWRINIRP